MLDIAINCAIRAGDLLRAGLAQPLHVEHKHFAELVTNVDRASEQLLVEVIQEHFPDHTIVAEESGRRLGSAEYTWLIDPLDGTTNYAHGFPFFAVSLGLLKDQELVLSVVYDPLRDELFTAERGSGAHCNGRRMQVSTTATLDAALLAAGFPHDLRTNRNNNLRQFLALQFKAKSVLRPGSAVLGLAYVALGRLDGFCALRLKPWDVSGALLISESGGRLSTWNGSSWSCWSDQLAASNGVIHSEFIQVLQQDSSAFGNCIFEGKEVGYDSDHIL